MPTEKIYYTSIITYKEHPQYGHPIDAKHVMSYMTRAPSQDLAELDAIAEGLLQDILQVGGKYQARSWEIPEKDIAGMDGIEFDRAYTTEELRQHGYKTIREYADDAELN